jgi:hypothetical protein
MKRILILALAAGLPLSISLAQADEGPLHKTGRTLEKVATNTGETIEHGAKATGRTLKHDAQATGRTLAKGAHKTGRTLKKVSS